MHPPPDRIIAAGEEVGVVGVQALDAPSGAADTTVRPRTHVISRDRGVTLSGVGVVRRLQLGGIDLRLRVANTALRLELSDAAPQIGIDEPVPRRHRAPVVHQGRVPDHHRSAAHRPHDDIELALGTPAEQRRYGVEIGVRRSGVGRRSINHAGRTLSGVGPAPGRSR